MLRHYWRIGFRSFLKNRTSSLINAIGLSLAIGCSVFVFVFIEFFMTIDRYHENGERIFVINQKVKVDNGVQLYSGTPTPMAPDLQAKFPMIETFSRLKGVSGYVRLGDKVFEEHIRFVDPGFLTMFSFPLKWGDVAAIQDPKSILLSEESSQKYFGNKNPLGSEVSIKFIVEGEERIETFKVAGVAKEFVKGSSFNWKLITNYENLERLGLVQLQDWGSDNDATFVMVSNPQEIGLIASEFNDYKDLQNESNEEFEVAGYQVIPFFEVGKWGQKVRGNIFSSPGKEGFIVLSILAMVIMAIACINYVNIAIASAGTRLREIGMRKVMGGQRWQLITQFLSENMIICIVAVALGLLWVQFLFLPGFKNLIPNPMELDLSDYRLWSFLIVVLLVVLLGGAGYPALYITHFQPGVVLRDKLKFGAGSLFRRILLGGQYFFSFVALVTAIVLIQNDRYQREIDWGYDDQSVLVIRVNGRQVFDQLATEIKGIPGIYSISGSKDQVGSTHGEITLHIEDEPFTSDMIKVGPEYLNTLGVPLISGRMFDGSVTSEVNRSILVNSTFLVEMGWKEALGKAIDIGKETYHIIGVTKDFHYQPFWAEISPLIIRLNSGSEYRFLAINGDRDKLSQINNTISKIWRELFPNDPYNSFHQKAVFDRSFAELDMITGVISTAGSVAIFLAAIGLFGLSALRIKSRMKEVSIRKVLGSNWRNLSVVLNKEFIWLMVIAVAIAAPVSYFAVAALLDTVTRYPVPFSYGPFVMSLATLLFISTLAVSIHILQAIQSNPVDVLRNE